jgi:hypothetical protein
METNPYAAPLTVGSKPPSRYSHVWRVLDVLSPFFASAPILLTVVFDVLLQVQVPPLLDGVLAFSPTLAYTIAFSFLLLMALFLVSFAYNAVGAWKCRILCIIGLVLNIISVCVMIFAP